MSRSFFLPDPDHFTAGTVGPAGQRTFFLQARSGDELVTLKVEKQQVAALADYLRGLLADLPPLDGPVPAAAQLVEPADPEWIVGGIGLAVDETADRIILVVHELVPTFDSDDEDDEDDEVADLLAELAGLAAEDDDDEDDDLFDTDEDEGAMARIRVTRAQAAAFIERASELVAAGRPLCPFCGLPSDPDGHFCPRAN
jgi:uncharacterized repeat protein (TIGR03847 family)